jgi:hypothetical protein
LKEGEGEKRTMAYTILRIDKHKSIADIKGRVAHQLREIDTPNADPKRRHLNIDSLKSSAEVVAEFERRTVDVKKTNRGKDKNGKDQRSVIALEYLLGISPTATWKKDRSKVKEWAKASLEFLEKKHGKGAVLSYHLQFDEQTPHLAVFVDTIKNGPNGKVFDAKRFTDGGDKLSALQTLYADAMKPFGLNRGVKGSKATHQKTKRYRARVNAQVPPLPSRLSLLTMSEDDQLGLLKTLHAQASESRARVEDLEAERIRSAQALTWEREKVELLRKDQDLTRKAVARMIKDTYTRAEFSKVMGIELVGKADIFEAMVKAGEATGFAHAVALVATKMPPKNGGTWETLARVEVQKPIEAPSRAQKGPQSAIRAGQSPRI